MSSPSPTPQEMLERLDARHDELIERLDELDAQLEATLADFAATRKPSPSPRPMLDAA